MRRWPLGAERRRRDRFGVDRTDVLLVAGTAVAYALLAKSVVLISDPTELSAGFWPGAGFSVALLLLLPTRRWPAVLLGVAAGELVLVLAHDLPVSAAVWWTIGNCIEPLVGAVVVRRGGHDGCDLVPMAALRRFLVGAVVAGPLAGGTVGAIGSAIAVGADFGAVLPQFVVGDAVGVMVVAPLLLCWRNPAIDRHVIERAGLGAALLALSVLTFRGDVFGLRPFMLIPLLTVAALRHGARGAAWSTALLTLVSSWYTTNGEGPFIGLAGVTPKATLLLQLFLLIGATTALVVSALVEDLLDRSAVEARLSTQASTDPLTGLPNRARLIEHLTERLRAPDRGRLAVLWCDLDRFKVVNDGLGHVAGDAVLVEVARRLRAAVRHPDMVARIGGDEFVVVVDGAEHLDAVIDRLLATASRTIHVARASEVSTGLSIGVATVMPGSTADSLMQEADAALYRAKELGRGRPYHFDDDLRLRVQERVAIETDLRPAMEAGDLSCVFQPEVFIDSGHLFGLEALARWHHPTRGAIPPARFVPVIEHMGASRRLFEHVLGHALDAQARWAKQVGHHPAVAVNLSAQQLGDPNLVTDVAVALARSGAPADNLLLEVTETALADVHGMESLVGLHELGIRLAIDDFGSGWSSLARLASFPWDILKIDKSFVDALGRSTAAEQVVRSTVAMAHAFGLLTVAEGVETSEQLERLAELGCDIAQGYLFARPQPAGQLDGRLTATWRPEVSSLA